MSEPSTGTPTEETGWLHDWLPTGFAVKDVEANGARLAVAVGGSGPTLVLLHGWPETGRSWRKVMPRLARDYTVVVPDMRGAGASSRPVTGYRKIDQAQDMRAVLNSLSLNGPSVVVGHDIGAMTALAWAAKYPNDISALVLLDVSFPGLGLEEFMDVAKGGMWHFGLFMTPGVPEMLFDGHEAEFFAGSFHGLSNPGSFTDEDLAFYVRAYTGRDRLRGGFQHYRDLLQDGRDNRELLINRPLAMPVLAIGGRVGMGTSVAGALTGYAERVTGAVAPTGHFVQEEDPDWLLDTLQQFLAPAPSANLIDRPTLVTH